MAGRSCCVMIEHDGAGRWWGLGAPMADGQSGVRRNVRRECDTNCVSRVMYS